MAKRAGKRRTSNKVPQRKKAASQQAFLDAFSTNGNISLSTTVAKIDRTLHYRWLKSDPEYVKRFERAQDTATDALEAEARRRAVQGVEEPVGWFKGQPGGHVTKYSDTLLIFLLKGARPERYRERFEHTGKDGVPLAAPSVTVTLVRPANGGG